MGKRGRSRQRSASVARRQSPAPTSRSNDPIGIVQGQVGMQQQVVAQSWRGPIPDADMLKKYQEVDPGLPDRILAMAEKTLELTERQTDHRIRIEDLFVRGLNFRAHAGLWLAFIISMAVLGSAVWLISIGHDAGGIALGGLDIASLAGVFIYGRYDQARQEQRRTG